jgi:hypothetical protein
MFRYKNMVMHAFVGFVIFAHLNVILHLLLLDRVIMVRKPIYATSNDLRMLLRHYLHDAQYHMRIADRLPDTFALRSNALRVYRETVRCDDSLPGSVSVYPSANSSGQAPFGSRHVSLTDERMDQLTEIEPLPNQYSFMRSVKPGLSTHAEMSRESD